MLKTRIWVSKEGVVDLGVGVQSGYDKKNTLHEIVTSFNFKKKKELN